MRPKVDADILKGMRLLGASSEVIEAASEQVKDECEEEGFGVFEENWKTFNFFRSLQTRWNVVVMPNGRIRRVSLKWLEVESKVNRTFPRKDRTALLELLETLELESIKVFSEQN